jgi:hypothetical protein
MAKKTTPHWSEADAATEAAQEGNPAAPQAAPASSLSIPRS